MFKKSIITIAVAMASYGVSAADLTWADVDAKSDWTYNNIVDGQPTYQNWAFVTDHPTLAATESIRYDGLSYDITNPNDQWVGIGAAQPTLALSSMTSDVVNNGVIHVSGSQATRNVGAIGVTWGTGNQAINNGLIFVDGSDTTQVHGILGQGGASGANAENGKIFVRNKGIGIVAYEQTEVENAGLISAEGEGSVGIHVGYSGSQDITVTNSGLVMSKDGAKAINVVDETENVNVYLKNDSDVEGLVDLNANTTLHFVNNTDTISLKDDVGTINIDDNSDATIKQGSTSTVNVGTLNGRRAKFAVEHITEGQKSIAIGTNNAEETTVDFSANVVDAYSAQEIAEAMSGVVDLNVAEGNTGSLNGYGTNFTASVDAVTGEMVVEASDLTQSTVDMAVASAVAWRNEITTLNDRMSTLRTSPSQYGAWARYNGGEYKYDDRHMDNQFNTIEVGGDARIGNSPWTVGASFAYTQGEGDFVNGSTESDTYSGALYAMWNHEGGSFVDMVAKVGSLKSDYDFYNLVGGAFDKGSLDRTGYIFGIETGHRFTVSDSFYVEPQVQLVYSSLSSESETTAHRTIDVDTTDSLVGRIGVMAGMNYAMGSAYVRVSGLRDFTGEVDGSFTTNGNTYKMSQDMDDSWVEFAIGTNLKVSDNFYVFADVQKSTGGDIDLDWRANVGAKLFF